MDSSKDEDIDFAIGNIGGSPSHVTSHQDLQNSNRRDSRQLECAQSPSVGSEVGK